MLLAHDHSELDAALADVFSALAGGNLEQSFARLDLFWTRLAMHIRAEHLHLFPTLLHALETREQGTKGSGAPSLEVARDMIAQLRDDHEFFTRLQAHNELEETKVYQWSDALLEPSERVALNEKIQEEIRNLPARFRTS